MKKIDVTRYEQVYADTVVAYIHGNYRIGVLVGMNNAKGIILLLPRRSYADRSDESAWP